MYIAHPAKDGINHQTVEQHLVEVHDFGKYSQVVKHFSITNGL